MNGFDIFSFNRKRLQGKLWKVIDIPHRYRYSGITDVKTKTKENFGETLINCRTNYYFKAKIMSTVYKCNGCWLLLV